MATGTDDKTVPKTPTNILFNAQDFVTPHEEQNSDVPGSDLTNNKEIFKIGIKIPPFWPDRPVLWFSQIEGQFALAGITSDITKFYYVSCNLERQYAVEVEKIITRPPKENKYNTLKSALIKIFTSPKEQNVKQLLDYEELGSRKPSQFLRHLIHLAGPTVPEEFVKTIWCSRLPISIQPIIASQPDMPLDKLAELADKVQVIAAPSAQISEVMPSTSVTPVSQDYHLMAMEALARQVEQLSKQVSSLKMRESRPNFRRRDQRSRSSSRARPHGVCWYHHRFGPKATRCTRPCSYNQSENERGSH